MCFRLPTAPFFAPSPPKDKKDRPLSLIFSHLSYLKATPEKANNKDADAKEATQKYEKSKSAMETEKSKSSETDKQREKPEDANSSDGNVGRL